MNDWEPKRGELAWLAKPDYVPWGLKKNQMGRLVSAGRITTFEFALDEDRDGHYVLRHWLLPVCVGDICKVAAHQGDDSAGFIDNCPLDASVRITEVNAGESYYPIYVTSPKGNMGCQIGSLRLVTPVGPPQDLSLHAENHRCVNILEPKRKTPKVEKGCSTCAKRDMTGSQCHYNDCYLNNLKHWQSREHPAMKEMRERLTDPPEVPAKELERRQLERSKRADRRCACGQEAYNIDSVLPMCADCLQAYEDDRPTVVVDDSPLFDGPDARRKFPVRKVVGGIVEDPRYYSRRERYPHENRGF